MLEVRLSALRLSVDWLHGWLATLGVADSFLYPAALLESYQPSEPPVHLQPWTMALQFLQAWTIALQFPQVCPSCGTAVILFDSTLCVHVSGLRLWRDT